MNLRFVCDADERVGFGHLQRCVQLGRLAGLRRPIDGLVFQGCYSVAARRRIAAAFPTARIVDEEDSAACDIAVMDRLGDPDELDSHPQELMQAVAPLARRYVQIVSGTTAPELPKGVCVGYQPGGPDRTAPDVRWGLQYAPVPPDLLSDASAIMRRPDRALIALGGNTDLAPVFLALDAMARLTEIAQVDVLLSPLADPPAVSAGPRVRFLQDVASVGPLLAEAGLVLASFGNLAYEALAAGAPLCLLGQKPFQVELAERLVVRRLAVSAGLATTAGAAAIAQALRETLRQAPELTLAGPRAVDTLGLRRIVDIMFEEDAAG